MKYYCVKSTWKQHFGLWWLKYSSSHWTSHCTWAVLLIWLAFLSLYSQRVLAACSAICQTPAFQSVFSLHIDQTLTLQGSKQAGHACMHACSGSCLKWVEIIWSPPASRISTLTHSPLSPLQWRPVIAHTYTHGSPPLTMPAHIWAPDIQTAPPRACPLAGLPSGTWDRGGGGWKGRPNKCEFRNSRMLSTLIHVRVLGGRREERQVMNAKHWSTFTEDAAQALLPRVCCYNRTWQMPFYLLALSAVCCLLLLRLFYLSFYALCSFNLFLFVALTA